MSPEYVYGFQLWIIFGIGLIVMETTDGRLIFFLPSGLGALAVAMWLYLTEISVLPVSLVPMQSLVLFLVWAMVSFVITQIMAVIRKLFFPKKPDEDVTKS